MCLGTAAAVARPSAALHRALMEGSSRRHDCLRALRVLGQFRRVSSSREASGNEFPTLEERCQTSTP
jgi:hypothetical protein